MESKPLILNHIRFLSDDKPLCHWPARLGHDQVYNTPTLKDEERPCKECQELLLVFQLRSKLSENQYSVAYIQDTYQNPLKTILLTGLITSAIWIAILVMFFFVVAK